MQDDIKHNKEGYKDPTAYKVLRKEQLEEQISDLNDEISDLELEYEV